MCQSMLTVEVFDAGDSNLAPQKLGAPAITFQHFSGGLSMAREGSQTETAPRATLLPNWDMSRNPGKKSTNLPVLHC